jgi:putative flippase GtrA
LNEPDTDAGPKEQPGSLLRSDIARSAAKYFLVGGVCALLEWAIFAGVLYGAGLHYLISGTISFVLSTGVNYYLSVRFVFGAGRRPRNERIFFLYLVSTMGIIANLGVLGIGIDVLGLHEMIAKIFATAAVFGWNFLSRYYFVFKQ